MPLYAILHGMPESEERKRLEDICRSINAIKISQQSYIFHTNSNEEARNILMPIINLNNRKSNIYVAPIGRDIFENENIRVDTCIEIDNLLYKA